MPLTYAKAILIGALLTMSLYGLYLAMFVHCMVLLWQDKTNQKRYIFVISFIFFLISMVSGFWVAQAVIAYTQHLLDLNAFLLGFPFVVPVCVFSTILTWITDWIMIYRVFVIWNHTKAVAIVPFTLGLAGFAFGIKYLNSVITIQQGDVPSSGSALRRDALLIVAETALLNVVATVLIGLKVWLLQRRLLAKRLNKMLGAAKATLAILCESAALYTLAHIAIFVPCVFRHNVQFVIFGTIPPIIGISLSIIMLRILNFRASPNESSLVYDGNTGSVCTGLQADIPFLDTVVLEHSDSRIETKVTIGLL